jgi:predicted TIM-barrel fold metal-dependent hydrolase
MHRLILVPARCKTAVTRDDRSDLPIKLDPCSNGEFVPGPASPLVREAQRRARLEADRLAPRVGLSRRRFLASLPGAALVLLTLDACSRDRNRAGGGASTTGASTTGAASTSTSTTAVGPGGTYTVPPESVAETAAATTVLAGQEFFMDVQGHLLDTGPGRGDVPGFGGGFPQANCGDDPAQCFTIEHFCEEIFLRSDTNLVVLSAIPAIGPDNPLSIETMEATRAVMLALCAGEERVLMHGQANPNVGELAAALDAMDALAAAHPIAAWKVYTHAPGPAWSFTDDVGNAFLERAVALGRPIVCVHKGLAGGSPAASPADIGPAAVAHPDARMVVYHSGFESGSAEGPYPGDGAEVAGVDRLVASLRSAGVAPGANVYAELGTTWRTLMGDPTQAAHLLGKLLVHVGEDNIVWGTDSIWYGSPQDQIQAFRAFEITAEFQERFGYPALTPERKAKILGLNAARLYGVEPATVPCPFTREDLQAARETIPAPFRTFGPRTTAEVAAVAAAEGH